MTGQTWEWAQAPIENVNDVARFAVSEQPVEPVVIPSQVTASSVDQSVYEKLASANTEEEKLAILEQNKKPEAQSIGSFKEALMASKTKALADVDAAIAELQQATEEIKEPVKEEPKEEPKEEEFEFTDEEYDEIVAEYEWLKQFKEEAIIRDRVKDNHITTLESKLSELQQEILNYKTWSVVLEDEAEQVFIQAKRAFTTEKNDSTKYYYLYSLNRILEPLGITIKQDIDQLYWARRWVNSPNVAPASWPIKPWIPSNLKRLGI